jgi:hypothetical protein
LVGKPEEDAGVDGRIILRWIFLFEPYVVTQLKVK